MDLQQLEGQKVYLANKSFKEILQSGNQVYEVTLEEVNNDRFRYRILDPSRKEHFRSFVYEDAFSTLWVVFSI